MKKGKRLLSFATALCLAFGSMPTMLVNAEGDLESDYDDYGDYDDYDDYDLSDIDLSDYDLSANA